MTSEKHPSPIAIPQTTKAKCSCIARAANAREATARKITLCWQTTNDVPQWLVRQREAARVRHCDSDNCCTCCALHSTAGRELPTGPRCAVLRRPWRCAICIFQDVQESNSTVQRTAHTKLWAENEKNRHSWGCKHFCCPAHCPTPQMYFVLRSQAL
jgi:hypothetical protein